MASVFDLNDVFVIYFRTGVMIFFGNLRQSGNGVKLGNKIWIILNVGNTLKIGFNNIFGYYIEVTKANAALVPDSYIRKQTLVNAERYINQ